MAFSFLVLESNMAAEAAVRRKFNYSADKYLYPFSQIFQDFFDGSGN